MASFLTARRQYSAAACRLHPRTEPVRLGAAASLGLKCALRQSLPPMEYAIAASRASSAMAELLTGFVSGSSQIG
jgi:hypothetical protein